MYFEAHYVFGQDITFYVTNQIRRASVRGPLRSVMHSGECIMKNTDTCVELLSSCMVSLFPIMHSHSMHCYYVEIRKQFPIVVHESPMQHGFPWI